MGKGRKAGSGGWGNQRVEKVGITGNWEGWGRKGGRREDGEWRERGREGKWEMETPRRHCGDKGRYNAFLSLPAQV